MRDRTGDLDLAIAMLQRQVAETGTFDCAAVEAATGVKPWAQRRWLSQEERAGRIQRHCTHKLANGERCDGDAPPTNLRGDLRISTCADHTATKRAFRTPEERPSGPLPEREASPVEEEPEPVPNSAAVVLRVDEVQGWPLAVVQSDAGEVATIEDVELGRRLGFERPSNIRKLIARYAASLGVLRHGAPGPDPRFRPYLLTEQQACFIAAKSETSKANELLRGMIAVFLAWRNGKLRPVAAADTGIAALVAEMRAARAALVGELRADRAIIVARLEKLERGAPATTIPQPAPGQHVLVGDQVVITPPSADGWLSVHEIADRSMLPVRHAARRSWDLVVRVLKGLGLHKRIEVARNVGRTHIGSNGPRELDQWFYDPAILNDKAGRVLRDAAHRIADEYAATESWKLAFEVGRRVVDEQILGKEASPS